jgi:hypothetical protein
MFGQDVDNLSSLYQKRVLVREFVTNTGQENDSAFYTPEHAVEVKGTAPINPHTCTCNHAEDEECDCCRAKKDYIQSLSQSMSQDEEFPLEDEPEHTEVPFKDSPFGVKQQLFRIVKMAAMLHDLINEDEEVDEEILHKIKSAYIDLDEAFGFKDYVEHRKKMESDMLPLGESVQHVRRAELQDLLYKTIKKLEK